LVPNLIINLIQNLVPNLVGDLVHKKWLQETHPIISFSWFAIMEGFCQKYAKSSMFFF